MRSLLMMASRWHRADDKVSCAEGYRCIYIRPNCDCITCNSEASRPISQGILSFYSGGHINHFFFLSRLSTSIRPTGTVWRDPKRRFNGIVISPPDDRLTRIRCPQISASAIHCISRTHDPNYQPKTDGRILLMGPIFISTLFRHNQTTGKT